jgi:uncharacterized protein (DUF433 family)
LSSVARSGSGYFGRARLAQYGGPILQIEGILKGGEHIMATLDWSQCAAVESIPGKVSGAWVFKDTRMPVSIVFENLEAGASISEIMDWFRLSREQVVAVIEFTARSLDAPSPSQQFAQAVDAHTV